jgi:membrane-bound metal-dependent hydrolase YbcI (DUF457 family)
MASYQGHLMFSSALGAAYGSAAVYYLNMDWGEVFLGAGLTAVGGLLPDVDSDSGVPVRELFGVSAVIVPLLLMPRLSSQGFSMEQTLAILAGAYLFVRYVLASLFKRLTVHRGMWHSIPAMLIMGLAVFLAYHSPNLFIRAFLSVGIMLGFLSHLVLDELCSVDFSGAKVVLNKYAGSALKFLSPSWTANLGFYAVLTGLGYLAYLNVHGQDVRDTLKALPSLADLLTAWQ